MKAKAIKLHCRDNVATALTHLKKDDRVIVQNEKEVGVDVHADIPFGHKFALTSIQKNGSIIKYGEIIGRATNNIQIGEHVHLHNVESLRGRGDISQ